MLSKFREGWCGRIAVTDGGRLVGRLTRSEVLRLVVHLRMIATVTEATVERRLDGPHYGPRRERLSPIRKMSKASSRSHGGRKLRRLAAS